MTADSLIEAWAKEEYRDGVSPGAAARQLCRSLGAGGVAPTLQRLLEDMLADFNRQNHEFVQQRDALRDVLDTVAKQ